VESIARSLLPWYRRSRRKLPWRKTPPDAYRVWVSELMLQQTRVEAVIPYFERFVERFPDVRSLAAAPLDDVLACWSGLGYYRRARSLHRAAGIVVEDLGGKFPEDVEGWLALPGVGRYTAGAVVSIAFGKRAPIVDGNVLRVLSRVFGVRGDPRASATRAELWRIAEEILPRRSVADFNQALMELGALLCSPRAPRCLVCPLRSGCVAHREGMEERIPEPPRRAAPVPVLMAAAVVERGRKVLLYRRDDAGRMRGLWELPMGTCRGGEAPRDAVAREARERYGVELEPGEELGRVKHSILNERITVHVFSSKLERFLASRLRPRRWVDREEISRLPLSSMIRKILDAGSGR
jgi:A/G-specific adenine glycosylase